VSAQGNHASSREADDPLGPATLGLAVDELAVDLLDAPVYAERAGIGVNVRPGEPECFPAAQAGGQQEQPERGKPVLIGDFEKTAGVVDCALYGVDAHRQDFSEVIKSRRVALGLSQAQLA
jgi:hypothetical protein